MWLSMRPGHAAAPLEVDHLGLRLAQLPDPRVEPTARILPSAIGQRCGLRPLRVQRAKAPVDEREIDLGHLTPYVVVVTVPAAGRPWRRRRTGFHPAWGTDARSSWV